MMVWRKSMVPNSKRVPILAAVMTAVGEHIRRGGQLLVEVLQGAYDAHMDRAQMRLAPLKLRSWREIPRAGANHDSWRACGRRTMAHPVLPVVPSRRG
jgi:hypothetical protein